MSSSFQHPLMPIKCAIVAEEPDEPPQLRAPVMGLWYHGVNERGTGAIAQYDGYGAFCLGDGTEVDMGIYSYLVEHHPPASR